MKTLLMTGSRNIVDEALVRESLRACLFLMDVVHSESSSVQLVHGAARGADSLAALEAERLGMRTSAHPAQWSVHAPECPPAHAGQDTCRSAGHRRNRLMLSIAAQAPQESLCVAFPDAPRGGSTSRGTWNMVDAAQVTAVPTFVVWGAAPSTQLWPANQQAQDLMAARLAEQRTVPGDRGQALVSWLSEHLLPF